MAITQQQVNEVCEEIAGAGEVPTLIKVRDALGSGSMATIAKMVREWKGATVEGADTPQSVTPESIQAMAAKMWAEAQRLAAMEYQAHRAEMAEELAAAEKDMESAYAEATAEKQKLMGELSQASRTEEALREEIYRLIADIEPLKQKLADTELWRQVAEEKAKTAERLAEALIAKIESPKPAKPKAAKPSEN